MKQLADFDLAELVEGPKGTVWWAPNDAYAPEYAGCVCGMSKNILPMRGNIHTYYTPSQVRSQNASLTVIFEMIEIAL
jgi:hypothetical protein